VIKMGTVYVYHRALPEGATPNGEWDFRIPTPVEGWYIFVFEGGRSKRVPWHSPRSSGEWRWAGNINHNYSPHRWRVEAGICPICAHVIEADAYKTYTKAYNRDDIIYTRLCDKCRNNQHLADFPDVRRPLPRLVKSALRYVEFSDTDFTESYKLRELLSTREALAAMRRACIASYDFLQHVSECEHAELIEVNEKAKLALLAIQCDTCRRRRYFFDTDYTIKRLPCALEHQIQAHPGEKIKILAGEDDGQLFVHRVHPRNSSILSAIAWMYQLTKAQAAQLLPSPPRRFRKRKKHPRGVRRVAHPAFRQRVRGIPTHPARRR